MAVSTFVLRNEVVNIPIFWDVAPFRLAVTDVSEKRIFFILRIKQNNYVTSCASPISEGQAVFAPVGFVGSLL